jgi:hypothetical protein
MMGNVYSISKQVYISPFIIEPNFIKLVLPPYFFIYRVYFKNKLAGDKYSRTELIIFL